MARFPTDPTNIAAKIANLERQVADLQSRVPASFSYVDATGVVRCRIGVHADGKFGMRVYAADGVTVLVDSTA